MNKLTLEQIKKDIQDGKAPRIYYSSFTLWWTHLESDVIESTKAGREYRERVHNEILNDPTVPEARKKQLRSVLVGLKQNNEDRKKEFIKNGGKEEEFTGLPLDPTGAPLYETADAMLWITKSENNPTFFGKHGIEAFLKSHHQNSKQYSNKWETYNNMLDAENA